MIERIHLQVIQAVELHGSLTAAAKELSVTQSALSHTVLKFENYLGTSIWLREGRSLRLTEAGKLLLNVTNPYSTMSKFWSCPKVISSPLRNICSRATLLVGA